jgi:LEA14-like dessication related protein
MTARSVNLSVEQGTNFTTTFTVKNPDGTILPLTGYTTAAKMAKHSSAVVGITTFSTSITSATGKITLTLSNATTSNLEPGRYYYDCVIQTSGGTITRIIEGMILVTAGLSS